MAIGGTSRWGMAMEDTAMATGDEDMAKRENMAKVWGGGSTGDARVCMITQSTSQSILKCQI